MGIRGAAVGLLELCIAKRLPVEEDISSNGAQSSKDAALVACAWLDCVVRSAEPPPYVVRAEQAIEVLT